MQNFRTRNRKHIEDNFDLDNFKEETHKKNVRKRYQKNKKTITYVNMLIAIFSLAIALLLFELFNYYIALWRNQNYTRANAEIITDIEPDPANKLPVFSSKPGDTKFTPKQETDTETSSTTAPQTERKVSGRFDAVFANNNNNEDIVGYLKIDDTNISEVVVQGEDNDYYLTHNSLKEENIAGAIYMDYENNIENFSDNTIIYGHNMRDGSKFHDVRKYQDLSYYESHKYIALMTLYDNTVWEIFSFYSTPTSFNYIKANFESKEKKAEFIEEIQSKSFYSSDLEVTADDKILTLSTCTNEEDNTRFVVHAKLKDLKPLAD